MATILFELDDRVVTDKGDVVAKHELLVQKALSGEVFTELPALPHPDIDLYNQRTGHERPIAVWEPDGTEEYPDPETYEWTIPKQFQELDVVELAAACLESKGLVTDEYVERLTWELQQMEERGMFPFIRCLLYVIEVFHKNVIVWGVGRGSSCASLVLYVLGINRVDPVRYNIPPDEFFK